MALATRTVAINAAFLQEIKDDHHELRQLMHHTAAMLARPTWMRLEYDRLVDLVTKLRDQLALHFSLEEAFGYFEDAIETAPRLSKRAEQLREQHGQLYAQFCRLVEQAEVLLYHETPHTRIALMAREYRHFAQTLQEHEAEESKLMLQAFHDDIGGSE